MTRCKYCQWDIVLVPFPFTDVSSTKKRPALILSSDEFNKKGNDYILCGITSQTFRSLEQGDFIVTNLKGTGLFKQSIIRVGRLGTFHELTIIRKIGTLGEESRIEIQGLLMNLFSIDIFDFLKGNR